MRSVQSVQVDAIHARRHVRVSTRAVTRAGQDSLVSHLFFRGLPSAFPPPAPRAAEAFVPIGLANTPTVSPKASPTKAHSAARRTSRGLAARTWPMWESAAMSWGLSIAATSRLPSHAQYMLIHLACPSRARPLLHAASGKCAMLLLQEP